MQIDRQDPIRQVLNKIRQFRDERDWMQFHDPKILSSIEENKGIKVCLD